MNEQSPRPIRVMIADDEPIVCEALAEYLAAAADIEVVSACTTGEDAVTHALELAPDVVLMDIRMPKVDGIAATRTITEANPDIRVVMLTTFDEDEIIADAFAAGAAGYLLKTTRSSALVEAVRAAHAGLSVVPPGLVSRWSPSRVVAQPPRLLPREREVLELLARGHTNAQIAAKLFVSPSTVKLHVAALMRKLDAENRTSLAARAHVLGLIVNERNPE
ncbi:MAG: response regulator transcription factor [Propionibacteriales bacterium]|nr:response regulator transcription factor [Propionibacteriales bacterium]